MAGHFLSSFIPYFLIYEVLQSERLAQWKGNIGVEWQKDKRKRNAHPPLRIQAHRGKTPQSRDLQKDSLPSWQSALKWGSKRGATRLHPFCSHIWIAFTCAPRADPVLSPGDQSVGSSHDSIVPIQLVSLISLYHEFHPCVCLDLAMVAILLPRIDIKSSPINSSVGPW